MLRHRDLPLPSHRLPEAFLRRIAADPEAEAFALRGGMLVRHWFPDMRRVARDVDVVCAWPFEGGSRLEATVARVRRGLVRLLTREVGDGVRFAERFRTDVIWPDTLHPGIRLVAPAFVDGGWDELHADLTFRLPVWPEARLARVGSGVLAMCRPEMIVARKLTVCADRGPRAWRPKDLADLWWILEHGAVDRTTLGEAIERTSGLDRFVEGPGRGSFWTDARAAMNWGRFSSHHPFLAVPGDLNRVVHDVRRRLGFFLPAIPERP